VLSVGERLGPLEVLASVGAGGMGEVYRARDTKLGRDVAVKVLPSDLADNPEALSRFKREAQTLASLNHPNIATIYGIEESGGIRALVMELVEGEDLSAMIARGPLPLAEALPIARQIADALEAAHEQGIVHRDLKPANVKVRADGVVKVLDFGLAKALDPTSSSGAEAMNSPTLTAHATQMGVILGTAAYMSPEQARGKPVDKRTDVWAFGAVLYEMLTGERAFKGEDISDTIAAVLRQEITLAALPATTPPRLTRLIGRCLERDPKQRLRDIGEARIELARIEAGGADVMDSPAATSAGSGAGAPAPSRRRERVAWGAAVSLLALVAVAAIAWALRPLPAPFETRLDITTPTTDDVMSLNFAISPDGRRLAYVAAQNGGPPQLWLRRMDQTIAQPLTGTEGAMYPFWSPDSQSVGFFTSTQLRRLDIGNGLLQTVTNAPNGGRGGTWSQEDVILFGAQSGPLARVPATGGAATTVTTFTPGQNSHRFPHFLPGGRQFVFYAMGAPAGIHLGSLDSPASKRLGPADTSAEFVRPNWLLFLRRGTLVARRIDLARGELTGDQVSVADQVSFNPNFSVGAFSVSSTGSIAYRTGNTATTQLTWVDKSGKTVGTVGEPDANGLLCPTLSPEERRVVAYRSVENNVDLWLFEAGRMRRLTSDAGRDAYPVWSPNGDRIVFGKEVKGSLSLYQKASGGGPEELLLESPSGRNLTPQSWSRDRKFLLYLERDPERGGDLWVLPMDGKQKSFVFVNSGAEERAAQFSPNGRWVAYSSDESNRMEIYVRPFPPSSGQWTVSTMGGVTPRWRDDGQELYYIAPDGMLMAVSVTAAGTAFEMGTPRALFPSRAAFGGANIVGITWQYDVAKDGRFLINVLTGDGGTAPITVIQNWTPTK